MNKLNFLNSLMNNLINKYSNINNQNIKENVIYILNDFNHFYLFINMLFFNLKKSKYLIFYTSMLFDLILVIHNNIQL